MLIIRLFADYCLYCTLWGSQTTSKRITALKHPEDPCSYSTSLMSPNTVHIVLVVKANLSYGHTCSISWMETPMAVERMRWLLQMCGLMLQSTAGIVSGFTARNTTSECSNTNRLSLDVWAPSICSSSFIRTAGTLQSVYRQSPSCNSSVYNDPHLQCLQTHLNRAEQLNTHSVHTAY